MKKIWYFVSTIGSSPNLTHEEARRVQLLSRLNFITFLVLLFYFIVNGLTGIYTFLPLLGITMLFLVCNLFLLHKKLYTPAKHFSVYSISFCISFFVLFNGDTFSEAFFIPLAAMPLIIFSEKKIAVWYLIAFVILIIGLKLGQAFIAPLVILRQKEIMIFKTMNVACSALIAYFLTFYFKAANEEYESTLLEMNEVIREKNKEIIDSIEYAKHIQNGILPSANIINACLPDSFIYYKPKAIVAGDFYWLEKKDNYVVFAACDCTGHGVPGAMVSVICSNALNRAVKEFGLIQPGEILTRVRELVVETFEKSEKEVKDGMDISLCTWNKLTNELLWAGANNPLWLVRHAIAKEERVKQSPDEGIASSIIVPGKDGKELIEIKANKQPIGKTDAPKPFTTHKLQLHAGDCMYVFTDGYADQFGGEKGKKFKYKSLQELLVNNSHKKPEEQKSVLSKSFDEWKGTLEQIDDVLIIGVRV
jgi:serine phosphatase RsbU (regulator of sigma subunit)